MSKRIKILSVAILAVVLAGCEVTDETDVPVFDAQGNQVGTVAQYSVKPEIKKTVETVSAAGAFFPPWGLIASLAGNLFLGGLSAYASIKSGKYKMAAQDTGKVLETVADGIELYRKQKEAAAPGSALDVAAIIQSLATRNGTQADLAEILRAKGYAQ